MSPGVVAQLPVEVRRRHPGGVSDEIHAEAERQLEQLRAARGLEPRPPHTLGRLFPPTRGVPLAEHHPAPPLPVPLEEWAAADPWDDEGPPPTR